MFLFICIFVGLVVGWLSGRSLEGDGYGPSVDIAMGVAGAVIGGLLMQFFGLSGFVGTALTTFVAITCAALLTTLTALGNGRRIHSRAF